MGWLHKIFGDTIFGTDLDKALAYSTPRVSKIQDANLGCLRFVLMFLIFLYICIFQIYYQGKHFAVHGVTGTYRLQLQEPTVGHCNPMVIGCESNFSSIAKLPYCLQATDVTGDLPKARRDCAYFDATELFTTLESGHLLPTKMATFKQKPGCTPTAENGWACHRKFDFEAGEGKSLVAGKKAPPVSDVFMADIEHFTLLIDHAYHRDGGGMSQDDFQMQGYFKDCKSPVTGERDCTKRPIVCVHDECDESYMITPDEAEEIPRNSLLLDQVAPPDFMKGSLLHTAGSMTPPKMTEGEKKKPIHGLKGKLSDYRVVSLKSGDVLSIRNLLDLAGIKSLDEARHLGTYRSTGMTLVVHIHYSNLGHWRLYQTKDPPEYTIEVALRPTFEFQYRTVNERASPEGHERLMYNFNGICIRIEQTGEIAMFDITTLLMILTTSLGLLAVSSTITDFLALSVLPKKEQYAVEKYKWSKDFSEESPRP